MKLLGILIIVNALILSAYWVSGEYQHKAWVLSFSLIAVFIGVILTLHDRALEISFKNIGTIKAAAAQATADANEIAGIRKRIEAQSATVDIVAQKANEAIKQLHKIAISSAEATITELMASEFLGGTNLDTRLKLHDQIISTLGDIGAQKEQISQVNKMWAKGVGIIYHRGIRKALDQEIGSKEPLHRLVWGAGLERVKRWISREWTKSSSRGRFSAGFGCFSRLIAFTGDTSPPPAAIVV